MIIKEEEFDALGEYDILLKEVKTKAEQFRSTAKEYVPKMYWALRNENSELASEDARDRIEKDCVGIWSKRTLLDALPDKAKDPKKQKAGRLRQKEPNSAALTAAPEARQIVSDAQGRATDGSTPPSETTVGSSRKLFKDQTIVKLSNGVTGPNRCITPAISECQNCLESALKIRELEEAVRKTTQMTRANEVVGPELEDAVSQHEDKDIIMPFEFWLSLEDVRRHIVSTFNLNKIKDKLWFNGTLNRQTGRVVAVNIGRIVSQREQKALHGEQE
jgi:hypothetical protein